jgi:hypothetical protein
MSPALSRAWWININPDGLIVQVSHGAHYPTAEGLPRPTLLSDGSANVYAPGELSREAACEWAVRETEGHRREYGQDR